LTNLKHTWPADEFEAINIKGGEYDLYLQGTDEDTVSLEGDVDEKRFRGLRLDIAGRWLNIFVPHHHSPGLILKLPVSKAWVTAVFAGKAHIQAQGVRSRLQIMVGNGDILIEDLRGILTIASGRTDIHLKKFTQDLIPQPSPVDYEIPEGPSGRTPWDWLGWGDTEWERWGEGLGEKIGWWALDFSRFFDRSEINVKNAGLSVHTGNGNLEASEINSDSGLFRISNGNLKLQEVQVADLNITVSHGNIEGRSLAPSGNWSVKNTHGNTRLSFASNVSARLDMATRNGNIHSDIPLVRVTRQGPETYYGKRMVGTIGPSVEGPLSELRIIATHGNIDVDSRSPGSQPASGPVNIKQEAVVSESSPFKTEAVMGIEKESPGQRPVDNTPQAILEALHEGKISVKEAEDLLKNMSL
jgi:hypothetical protein